MAHLSITINEKNDLFEIGIDRLGDLTVNGTNLYNGPYAQSSSGMIQFSMDGSGLDIVNPDTVLYLKNTAGTKTYVCWLGFLSDGGSQTIYGMAITVDGVLREAKAGPAAFNQGNLSGSFSVKS